MDIDIYQLPIPEWDLTCPGCGYLLNGLPTHRCSECGRQLDMAELIGTFARLRDPTFTGMELPLPDFGLYCLACGFYLAGASEHRCPDCDRPFDPAAQRPTQAWFPLERCQPVTLPWHLLAAPVAQQHIPYIYGEEHRAYVGTFTQVKISREFYFDLLFLVRQLQQEAEAAAEAAPPPGWTCPACGKKNPGNFELCWNCEAARTPAGETECEGPDR